MILFLGLGDNFVHMEDVMEQHCPVCKLRISDWQSAGGKTTTLNKVVVHNSCFQDWKLRHGDAWTIEEIVQKMTGG